MVILNRIIRDQQLIIQLLYINTVYVTYSRYTCLLCYKFNLCLKPDQKGKQK